MQENPHCSTTVTHGLKRGNPLFDVTMRIYNGAEVCKLLRLYLVSKLASDWYKKPRAL